MHIFQTVVEIATALLHLEIKNYMHFEVHKMKGHMLPQLPTGNMFQAAARPTKGILQLAVTAVV